MITVHMIQYAETEALSLEFVARLFHAKPDEVEVAIRSAVKAFNESLREQYERAKCVEFRRLPVEMETNPMGDRFVFRIQDREPVE